MKWLTFVVGSMAAAIALAGERPNVLLVIADDLRTEMGCYGSRVAHTPHLDALAASGMRWDRAYCQFPLCNPSRSSMLTGRHPTSLGVLGNRDWFGVTCPQAVSLPRRFKDSGYRTIAAGKIFHGGIDDTEAWTEGGVPRHFGSGATAEPPEHDERGADGHVLSKTERSDRWIVLPGDGKGTGDHRIADRAIRALRERANAPSSEPFFLACGFHKPHSPPEAPQWCYDLIDGESLPLPRDYAPEPTVPAGFPAGSIRPRNADLFVGRSSTPESAREMIRAYLASSAWMDFNAGRVLDELERLGLASSTIVVFWGDHGYQLGEKGKWSKAGSLWEQGLRTPLLIRAPGVTSAGTACAAVVEMIDLYPTLCDLCGVPAPEGLEGRSLVELLRSPQADVDDRPAFASWSENGITLTGVAIRTRRWHFAEFFGRGEGVMLIDPAADPDEQVNRAADPQHADLVKRFSALARRYAEGRLPDRPAAGD